MSELGSDRERVLRRVMVELIIFGGLSIGGAVFVTATYIGGRPARLLGQYWSEWAYILWVAVFFAAGVFFIVAGKAIRRGSRGMAVATLCVTIPMTIALVVYSLTNMVTVICEIGWGFWLSIEVLNTLVGTEADEKGPANVRGEGS